MRKILCFALVVLLLAGIFVSCKNPIEEIAQHKTVVKTENYTVNSAMMSYFFMDYYNQTYQYYLESCRQYGLTSGMSQQEIHIYVCQMMGFDGLKPLKEQYMDHDNSITAFDYYLNLTKERVLLILTCCELALDYGITLEDRDHKEIDAAIEEIKINYEIKKQMGQMPYSSFGKYLNETYGNGVDENVIRDCHEMTTLAAKAEEKLYDEIHATVLDQEGHAWIEQYVKENPSSFLLADYYLYTFSVKSIDCESEAEFEVAQRKLLEEAKALAAGDAQNYKETVMELLRQTEHEEYYNKNWDKYLDQAENDEVAATQKLNEDFEWEAIKEAKYTMLLNVGYQAPSDPNELSKWIFGFDGGEHEASRDAAVQGDIAYFEQTDTRVETVQTGTGDKKEAVTTYTISVYLLDRAAYRNQEITKRIGWAMFSEKEDAEKFYEAYSKLQVKNKDTMMDLLGEFSEELFVFSCGAYEDYKMGDMERQHIKGVDQWIKNAKSGDVSKVLEIEQESVTGNTNVSKTLYTVVVFDGDGYEYWFAKALAGATNEQVSEWFEKNTIQAEFDEHTGTYIRDPYNARTFTYGEAIPQP